MDPGEDEEAGVVDDAWESGDALSVAPADPGISGGDFPGGAGEADESQRPVMAADAIAQLVANGLGEAEIVVGGDGGIPLSGGGSVVLGDAFDGDGPQEMDGSGQFLSWVGDGLLNQMGASDGRCTTWLWQGDESGLGHAQHDHACPHETIGAIMTPPVEQRAHTTGEFCP